MADRREFEIGGKLLSTLRVVDLKLELEKRGLSKSGSKKELADRLKVQLRLEKLQEDASTDEGHVPNLRLQDDEIAEQNDLIKDYLAKQQQTYEMQKEARRRVELEEQRVRDSSEASAEDTSQGEEEPELRPPVVVERKEPSKVPDFPAEAAPTVKEQTTDKKKHAKESKLSSVEPETILPSVVTESSNDEASMEAMDLSKSDESRQQELSKNIVVEEEHESPEEQAKITEEQPKIREEPVKVTEEPVKVTEEQAKITEEPKPDEQTNVSQSDEPSTESVITDVQNTEPDQKPEQEDIKEGETTEMTEVESKKEDVIEEVKDSQEASEPTEQVQIAPAETVHGSSPEAVDMSNKEVSAKETGDGGGGRRSERAGSSSSPSRDSPASESHRRRSRRSSSSSRSSTSSRSRSSDSQSSDSRSRSHKRGESKRSETYHEAEPVEDSASQSSLRQELEVKVDAEGDKMMDVEESSSTVDEVSNRETKVSSKPDESKPTPEVVAKVTTRKISISSLKESQTSEEGKENHETGEFQAPRKRKWGNSGATTTVIGKKASLSISTDSLKGLIPELKPLSSVNTGSTDSSTLPVETLETRPVPVAKPPPATPTTKREIIVFHTNNQPEKDIAEKVEPPVKVNRTLGRRISVNTNAELAPNKITPSPARHPPTRIIHMRNLVRPFTLNQLKELLSKTGSLVEGGFWIDKIKSKCYVTYENEDQAISTRQALHGTQWPSSNPKILSVDFATQDELDFHRSLAEATDLKRVPPTVENQVPNEGPIRPKALSPRARGAKQSVDEEKPAEKARRDSHRAAERENKEKERPVEKDKQNDRGRNQQVTELNNNTERGRVVGVGGRRDREVDQRARGKDKGRQPPIREWDRDKIGERSPGERDRARVAHNRNRSRSRSRSRGVRSPLGRRDRNRDPENRDRNDRRREEEAPAKLLDDLFRKTKTAPCIYWLPLTVEQIHMKEEQRKQRQVEREKRRQQHDQTTDNVKAISQRSRSRDKEENRNWRKSKSPAKSRGRRR